MNIPIADADAGRARHVSIEPSSEQRLLRMHGVINLPEGDAIDVQIVGGRVLAVLLVLVLLCVLATILVLFFVLDSNADSR